MLRDEDDLQLLAELGGVLDQTVTAAGLSSGSYLVLRELRRGAGPASGHRRSPRASEPIPSEIAVVCKRLVSAGLAATQGSGVAVTDDGRAAAAAIETEANEAMRAYVVERPHTATVYGLVASMQSGRFTVEDLLAFLAEGPTDEDA